MKLKTLYELNVKPGDVVMYHHGGVRPITITDNWKEWGGRNFLAWEMKTEKNPKWKDMTDSEKGAMLLAHHNGEKIEYFCASYDEWHSATSPQWQDDRAYRVKPAPVVLEYEIEADGHVISYKKIDGVPDCNSVKMKKI